MQASKIGVPYEWLTSYDKLRSHGPIKRRSFYSSLKKKKLSRKEYEKFQEFYKRGCVTMHDWLKEYNIADVEPFIEAVDKTRHQYFPDKLNMLKDAVSIPSVLQSYFLNKVLEKRRECKLSDQAIHANTNSKVAEVSISLGRSIHIFQSDNN